MPFEFLGADLETEEGREAFVDTYAMVVNTEFGGDFDDQLKKLFEHDPEAGVALIEACASHPSPLVRSMADTALKSLLEYEPRIAKGLIINALKDGHPDRSSEMRGEVKVLLTGEENSHWIGKLGLNATSEIIRTLRQVPETE